MQLNRGLIHFPGYNAKEWNEAKIICGRDGYKREISKLPAEISNDFLILLITLDEKHNCEDPHCV
jgi:hypothetical protein